MPVPRVMTGTELVPRKHRVTEFVLTPDVILIKMLMVVFLPSPLQYSLKSFF